MRPKRRGFKKNKMRYQLDNPLTTLTRCPQCGTARPTLNLRTIIGTRTAAPGGLVRSWAVYQCTSCDDVVCFKGPLPSGDQYHSAEEYLSHQHCWVDTIMPDREDDFTDWPERARRYMVQAVDTLGAPDGAIMLAGSAVDAMLKEKGLTDGTVYTRIEQAVENNLLTEAMGQWAHAVRLSANNPRHADLDDPHATLEEARAVIDFVKALGLFLFVLPARIQRGKEAADKASEDALEAAEPDTDRPF